MFTKTWVKPSQVVITSNTVEIAGARTLVPSAMRLGWAATLLQAMVAPLSVSSFRNDMAVTAQKYS